MKSNLPNQGEYNFSLKIVHKVSDSIVKKTVKIIKSHGWNKSSITVEEPIENSGISTLKIIISKKEK
jgi:hypothetical protein